MANRQLQTAVEELCLWWSSESDGFRHLVLSILASLPGGDELSDIEPIMCGWKEIELLGNLLVAMKTASDVNYVVRKLTRVSENEQ